MYLKLIELTGFKSFAEKTRIELDRGFTAIVGPNGSGKSNITEAIKWVLGEQSAKSLRGKRMDDVIFAGSEAKRKAQYAEVTLTFNNEDRVLAIDQDEVSISRRYTRSGEATYMINRRQCRLKDITELMLDTGVGRDSFSIISQGRVEAIFTQKAEERRGIFEEAAGVMKYKSRKVEAERKLARAEDNLNRIEDILSEVAGQLEPLEDQRNVALKYQATKQELSEIEIALTSVQVETLSEQWQVAQRDLEECKDQVNQLKADLKTYQDQADQVQSQEEAKEDQVNQPQTDYVDTVQKTEKLQGKIRLYQEKQDFHQRDQSNQQNFLAELDQGIQEAKQEVESLSLHVDRVRQDYADQEKEHQRLNQALEELTAGQAELLETKRNDYIDALQAQARYDNEQKEITKESDRLKDQLARYQKDQEAKQAQYDKLTKDREDRNQAYQDKKKSTEDLLNNYQELAQEAKTYQAALEAADQAYRQAHERMIQVQARLTSLEDLEESHAGFFYGVKNALGMKDRISGIHGAVADLIQVDPTYPAAVETALGGGLQNIVTADAKVASQVIQALKKERGGRATFLPLAVIRPRQLSQQVLNQAQSCPGYVGVLADLVTYESTYRAVMMNLMGTTLVADNLDNARQMAAKLGQRQRIVTLEGDIIHAGGSMTGGQQKQDKSGLLSRKQEIDRLQVEEAELAKAQSQSQADRQAVQTKGQAILDQMEAVKEAGSESRLKEQELKQALDQVDRDLKNLAADLDLVKMDQATAKDQIQELDQRAGELDQKSKDQAEAVQELKASIERMNLSESDRAQRLQDFQAELRQFESQFAVLAEQKKQAEKDYQAAQATLKQKEKDQVQTKQALADLDQELSEHSGQAERYQADYQAAKAQLKEVDQALKAARQARKDLQKESQALSQKQQALNDQLQEALGQQAKLGATVSRYEVSIDNHLDHLREEYGLTYERAREISQLDMSMEAASTKVRQLKQTIEDLGPVNLAAIKDYEEVKERHDFMTKQWEDADQAKTNLYQTIQGIDQEVTERFKVTFEAIRDAFETVFPKLFGGGKATLVLTDPDDLLNTGVEIMAQPPGKHLQLLSLLSGGERALTAIALLFAILHVKTIPFTILDEVEAALDDANVRRYGQYLQNFSKENQFIVITHRKGTMEAANVLYGVTMQESGISKLASVSLADFDAEALEEGKESRDESTRGH
ncbi:chromosome segregation protein SMC [Aerococcus sanguinicola]|uniref:chromosome segregation protein SMC n=1 Tax=Aerococcus sanguinicola TaxID=119206 RepID=UPI0018A7D1C8|nr:chromosome segregation protein SMC [Aerococcus sanguinicola]